MKKKELFQYKNTYVHRAVVSGGARGASTPGNLGVLVTLFQPEGADCAHHITASTPGFEKLTTSLVYNYSNQNMTKLENTKMKWHFPA